MSIQVTFALFVYNQELYVEEAVKAALGQTYRPIQIIISDDASTDNSYRIIEKLVEEYQGDAELMLNLNESNLGIGAHINRVMELVTGELIVGAAGDDISYPHRTSTIVREWKKQNCQPLSILSAADAIDENGGACGVFDYPMPPDDKIWLIENWFYALGAAHAWSAKVFEIYGPLLSEVTFEDTSIVFRSFMLGSVHHISQPLLKYRVNVGITRNVPSLSMDDVMFRIGSVGKERVLWGFRQREVDLQKIDASKELLALAALQVEKQEFLVKLSQKNRVGVSEVNSLRKNGASLSWIVKKMMSYKFIRLYDVWLRARGLR